MSQQAHLGTPRPSFLLVKPILFKGFYFLIKSHFWPNLVLLDSIVGGFGRPSWHFLATENQSKNCLFFRSIFNLFGYHLGSQKWTQNRPKVGALIDAGGVFGVLESTWPVFSPSWFLFILGSHFCQFWDPRWLSKSTQNRSKFDQTFNIISDAICEG